MIGACIGMAIVSAPFAEGAILHRTNRDITAPALALASIGAAHCGYLYWAMPETNKIVLKGKGGD